MRSAIFPLYLSKVPRLPRKSDARSYKVLHLSHKIISANLKIWCSKMQPPSGNQRTDFPTDLMNMSLVLHPRRKMHLCRSSSNVPRLPSFLDMPQNTHVLLTSKGAQSLAPATRNDIWTSKSGPSMWSFLTFWLRNMLRATTAYTFSASQLPKVVPSWCLLYILTWNCASHHNSVHFFDVWTSKSRPTLRCFVHFDFEMCFTPQQRALFRHLNSKSRPTLKCFVHFDFEMCFAPQRRALFRQRNFYKCSGAEVLCTFWLRNVLHATMACNFSSLIWPAGSAPAALASLLFDPPEPQIIGKTQCFATFLPFRAPGSSFFWDFSLSSSLLFSDSSHLCFSSVHIVGSLTSKLPPIISS